MDISAVDICNLALDRIGAAHPISSLTDGTSNAALLNRVYPIGRNEVLRAHPWSCAIERATLAQTSTVPLGDEWEYEYQLPTSPVCLRVLDMPGSTAEYRIEGDKLLTNEEEVIIRYVKEQTDTTKYPPDLVELIALKIASMIAFKITQSRPIEEGLKAEYEYRLREAKGRNQLEYKEPDADPSLWIDEGR